MTGGKRLLGLGGLLALAAAFSATSCGGGGGGGSNFAVEDLGLKNNDVWRINRPIEIRFNKTVDLNSVNLNTIAIRQSNGTPSAGSFSYLVDSTNKVDKKTIVFQPVCPKKPDYSDAGLLPGGIQYEITIQGADQDPGNTVRSTDGDHLSLSQSVVFVTPNSTSPNVIFYDPIFGGPRPLVRSQADPGDDTNPSFTYLEIGGDPTARVYFEKTPQGNIVLESSPLLPNGTLPLNPLSLQSQKVALIVFFDQPIDPGTTNINPQRLRWEYRSNAALSQFTPLDVGVTLVTNCVQNTASVRIEPRGDLPPDTLLRGVIAASFQDLVGEDNLLDQTNFAVGTTDVAPQTLADEFLENFLTEVYEDKVTGLGDPQADWGSGVLAPSFAFPGNGGTQGTFDLLIPANTTVVFNTVSSQFVGGPGFVPSVVQTAVGGVLDVRNLRVDTGGKLVITGPNTAVITATGNVEILGLIALSGGSSTGVNSLNTTNIPEPGASGQAGGGSGGTGSPLTSQSSPKGGNGFGAFNVPDAGGGGGETTWNEQLQGVANRRGSGGGGGLLGANQLSPYAPSQGVYDQTFIGLDAEKGFDNETCASTPPPKGAISGVCPSAGGPAGVNPFTDFDPNNNFYGSQLDQTNNRVIIGELQKPWAGAGGGAGGDASYTAGVPFPAPWDPTADEKGSGGGGGAGGLRIMTLGNIVFGPAGQILAQGGNGGGGENTIYFNRVGGGSGGGSGGHVILESALKIDMSQITGTNQAIFAPGGEGGAGANDDGGATLGASGTVQQPPNSDACPPGYPTGTAQNACLGHIDGAGGDGGPGIIQLHVNNNAPGGDLLLPLGKTLADICKPTPIAANGTSRMIPSFGRFSSAQSIWVPMGLGGFDSTTGLFSDVTFAFGGTDPLTGYVNSTAGTVTMLPPLIPAALVDPTNQTPPFINPANPYQMIMDASSIAGGPDDYLLTAPQLMRGFLIEETAGVVQKRFTVVDAVYTSVNDRLTLTVDPQGGALTTISGTKTAALIPAYFRVENAGVPDDLPITSTIRVKFEATTADSSGLPDTTQIVGPVTDITLLNTPGNALLRFVRFNVTFDIDAQGQGLTPANPRPVLDYMKVPFRY